MARSRALTLLRSRRRLHTTPPAPSEALGPAAQLPESDSAPRTPTTAAPRLRLADLAARRAAAGRLVAGTAAYSDSDMFKGPAEHLKPAARRWDHLISAESAARQPCKLKLAARHLKKPGLISLGGGLPSPANFPIESLSFATTGGQTATMGKYDVSTTAAAAGGDGGEGGVGAEYDLAIALNYAQSTGSAQLLRWVTEHTELCTPPAYGDWRCALTVGSTGALEQALRIFCDRAGSGSGEGLLTEEYSFSTAVETALPLGLRVWGVPMDEQGLLPEKMDEMLAGWDGAGRGGAGRPRVLYTVPSGQNPTGATQGEQRRRDIYAVCSKHDVFILEDEPYYFLQMPPYKGQSSPVPSAPIDPDTFLTTLIPSLLSMDTEGRVLRMDSFSKVVVPGSRLGWVTGSAQVVDRYVRHSEAANQGPSGFSQAVLFKLLDETWGHAGYLRWLMGLREEYMRRRDAMLAACDHYLPGEVVSWDPPAAGMFHWLRVDHKRHPDTDSKTIMEIEEEIFNLCIEKGVLVGRGSWFRAEQDKAPTGLFFRANYASATPEVMAEAIRRIGAAVRQSYRLE